MCKSYLTVFLENEFPQMEKTFESVQKERKNEKDKWNNSL